MCNDGSDNGSLAVADGLTKVFDVVRLGRACDRHLHYAIISAHARRALHAVRHPLTPILSFLMPCWNRVFCGVILAVMPLVIVGVMCWGIMGVMCRLIASATQLRWDESSGGIGGNASRSICYVCATSFAPLGPEDFHRWSKNHAGIECATREHISHVTLNNQ